MTEIKRSSSIWKFGARHLSPHPHPPLTFPSFLKILRRAKEKGTRGRAAEAEPRFKEGLATVPWWGRGLRLLHLTVTNVSLSTHTGHRTRAEAEVRNKAAPGPAPASQSGGLRPFGPYL